MILLPPHLGVKGIKSADGPLRAVAQNDHFTVVLNVLDIDVHGNVGVDGRGKNMRDWYERGVVWLVYTKPLRALYRGMTEWRNLNLRRFLAGVGDERQPRQVARGAPLVPARLWVEAVAVEPERMRFGATVRFKISAPDDPDTVLWTSDVYTIPPPSTFSVPQLAVFYRLR